MCGSAACTAEGSFISPAPTRASRSAVSLAVQHEYNAGAGGVVIGSQQMGPQGRFTRDLTNDINYRVRGVLTYDVRQQTEYGTLRTYFKAGWENTTPGATGGGTTATAFWERAFIQ